MVQATAECHKNSIIHRDIKPDNFLVKKEKVESSGSTPTNDERKTNVKLADFGIACKYDPLDPPTQKCGTREYVAPEVLSSPHYDTKVDVYSLGVILFELLSNFETT